MDQSRLKITFEQRKPFRLTFIDIELRELPPEFEGYLLTQFTDLHYGPFTKAGHLRQAVEIAAGYNPDLLLMTGDYLQYSGTGLRHIFATRFNPIIFRWTDYRRAVRTLAEELNEILSPLQPPDGVIAIAGNHDYTEGLGTIRRKLSSKIIWLNNSATLIKRGESSLSIAGLDDLRYGNPDIKQTLDQAKAGNSFFRILLSHSPDLTLLPQAQGLADIDLILSGHTHGGQICLPPFGPIVTRTRQRKHFSGLSYFNSAAVYVTNGLGYGGLPIRLFCPPEITFVRLRNAA